MAEIIYFDSEFYQPSEMNSAAAAANKADIRLALSKIYPYCYKTNNNCFK